MKNLLLFLLFISTGISAQSSLKLKEVIYYGAKSIPDHIPRESFDEIDQYTTKLYVIGWSKNGNLAYVYYYPACCSHGIGLPPRVEIRIQDMKSDEILWSEDIYDEKEDYEGDKNITISLINNLEVKNKLNEYQIIIQKWSGYFSGRNYMDYTFDISKDKTYEVIVDAKSKKLGSKNIFKSIEPPFVGFEMENNGEIAGVIKSPFEERVAVIHFKNSNLGHWEYMTDYILIGCDLKNGFK